MTTTGRREGSANIFQRQLEELAEQELRQTFREGWNKEFQRLWEEAFEEKESCDDKASS